MPCVWISTWFGAGLMARAPGTWGSLAALPFAWVLHEFGGPIALACAAVILYFPGVWAANGYMAGSGEHDPGPVVVDEVVGQWLVLAVIPAPDFVLYVLGFALFRLFDILKPWPISWADQNIAGGHGVMFDDVLAGVAGAVALIAIQVYIWPGVWSLSW